MLRRGRHARIAAALAILALVGVVLALGFSVRGLLADARAEHERAKREIRASVTEVIPSLSGVPGTAGERLDLLTACERRLAALRDRNPDDGELDELYAGVLDGLGDLANARSDRVQEFEYRNAAERLSKKIAERSPGDLSAQRRHALALVKLGDSYNAAEQFAEARNLYNLAGDIRQRLYDQTGSPEDLDELCWREARLGWIAVHQGDQYARAIHLDRHVELARRQLVERGPVAASLRSLCSALTWRSSFRRERGDDAGWAADIREAHQAALAAADLLPRNRYYRLSVADTWSLMGDVAAWSGDLAERSACRRRAAEAVERVFDADRDDKDARWGYLSHTNSLAIDMMERGDPEGALAVWRRAIDASRLGVHAEGVPQYEEFRSGIMVQAAALSLAQGDEQGSRILYDEALTDAIRWAGSDSPAGARMLETVVSSPPAPGFLDTLVGRRAVEMQKRLAAK